jgi:carboxypeptidase T
MFHALHAFVLASASLLPAPAPQSAPHVLVAVDPAALRGGASALSALGIDHIASNPENGTLEFAASPEEVAALRARRIPFRVLIDDLESYYASRLSIPPEAAGPYGTWLTPAFGQGAMGGYYTYAQVGAVLDQMSAAYPSLMTVKTSIGTSVEGRSLWMVKISDNPGVDENEPETRFDALHHAREPESMQATLWFMLFLLEEYGSDPLATYLVNEREFFFVPCVNPDGYVYNQTTNPGGGGMWRKNRRVNGGGTFGIDLNRNYTEKWGWDDSGSSPSPSSDTYRGPSPASEPEIAAMIAFISGRQFKTTMSTHTYGNYWLYPYGYANLLPGNNAQYLEVTGLATEVNHYLGGPIWPTLYPANGVTVDYDHNVQGAMSWTAEIGGNGDGFWPASNRIVPLAEENLLGFQRTALAAGAYVRSLSVARSEVGDGDGYFESGESVQWRLTVRNSGRAATATPVVLGLSSASPWVNVTANQASLGSLGSFAQGNNNANPLALSILPGAPGGISVNATLTIAAEGWTQSIDTSFVIGEPVPFLIDDAELDLGWTKGLPGDTATSGRWVRGDPVGTNNAGQPCNPEDDATAAPGVNAFVTGNGGGSASTDDVDNGITTLISPIFDLSGVGPATLSYARWFADFTVADDVFAVALSNDGGTNWTPLENLALTANQWNQVSFPVSAYLPQTANMRLRFIASDAPNNSVVEAAVDELKVTIFDQAPRLNVYGKPQIGQTVMFHVTGQPGDKFAIAYSLTPPTPSGPIFGAKRWGTTMMTGTIPAGRLARLPASVPSSPTLPGTTMYFRALVGTPGNYQPTNWASVTLQ